MAGTCVKALLSVVLLAAAAMAQCDLYADNAKAYLDKGDAGGLNGAAQEYDNAAQCYANAGLAAESNTYYGMAAINYVAAARIYDEAAPGGDIGFKVNAFAAAARDYAKIGNYDMASEYFSQAMLLAPQLRAAALAEEAGDLLAANDPETAAGFYGQAKAKFANSADSARIDAKTGAMSGAQPMDQSYVLFFWIMLFIILMIILGTTVLSVSKRGAMSGPQRHEHAERAERHESAERHEAPRAAAPAPRAPEQAGAKGRALDKLRKKYASK